MKANELVFDVAVSRMATNKDGYEQNRKDFGNSFYTESHTIQSLFYVLAVEGYPVTMVHHRAPPGQEALARNPKLCTFRHLENFISMPVIGLDDDRAIPGVVDSWLADDFTGQYGAFLYQTSSSSPGAEKCRVMFVLEHPITDPAKAKKIMLAFHFRYPHIDRISDVTRVWYGARATTGRIFGNVLPLAVLEDVILSPYEAHLAEVQARHDAEYEQMRKRSEVAMALALASGRDIYSAYGHYIDRSLEGIFNKVSEGRAGTNRHSLIFWAGARVGEMMAANWATQHLDLFADIESRALDAGLKNGYESQYKDTIRTFQDGVNTGRANPAREPVIGANMNGSATTVKPGIDAYEQAKQNLSILEAPQLPVFIPLSLDDVLSLPPKDWLIDNIIGKEDIGMIFGKEGTGKTFVLLDSIFCAAIGGKWAGRFDIPKPLKIAYCSDEGRAGLPDRLRAAAKWYGEDSIAALKRNITFFLDTPQLFNHNSVKNTSRFIDDLSAAVNGELDILVIDTLHNATTGANENDNGDAGIVLQSTKMIRDALGCATIFAHHVAKGTGSYRGASAYAGDMDVMIEISGSENPRKMSCYKAKDALKFDTAYFHLRPVETTESVVAEWLGEGGAIEKDTRETELLEIMRQTPDELLTATQWGEAIGVTRSRASQILKNLVDMGEITRCLEKENKPSKTNPWRYSYS